MSNSLKTAMGIAGLLVATSAAAQVTFYSRDGFRGESFTADREVRNMERTGFNDRAQSAVVQGGSWQVCEDARFEGRCVVLQPGEYPSLSDMGLGREISSVRAVEQRYGSNDDRSAIDENRRRRQCDAKPVLEALAGASTCPWGVLIGPEGGFSASEREKLRALPFATAATLGPRILRADTAAISALTLWQAALGDWGGPLAS